MKKLDFSGSPCVQKPESLLVVWRSLEKAGLCFEIKGVAQVNRESKRAARLGPVAGLFIPVGKVGHFSLRQAFHRGEVWI